MNPEKITASGWTADLPDGWEDRSMITLVAANYESSFAPNIVVTRQKAEPGAASLEDYAARQAEMMRNEIDTLQILDERTVSIGGAPSFQRLQRFMIDGGQIIQQVQTFFSDGKTLYAITGTAPLEFFDQSIPAFKKFVETFRLS